MVSYGDPERGAGRVQGFSFSAFSCYDDYAERSRMLHLLKLQLCEGG